MNVCRRVALCVLLGTQAALVSPLRAQGLDGRDVNAWPARVSQHDATGETISWQGAGPLLFRQPVAGGSARGFRPLWVEMRNPTGEFQAGYFLYPLFSYARDETTYRWSLLELIRRTDRRAGAEPPRSQFDQRGGLEIWPFWFWREAGDPELSFRGLFPIAGTVRHKLGMERVRWVLFPLYAEVEKRGAVTTHTPWPFIRVTRGAAHGGGFWPFYTSVEHPGVSQSTHYLWPLGYDVTRLPSPDDPSGAAPRRDVGFLPFYARSTGPGQYNVSYGWPFFGHTEHTQPKLYREYRYFWPLLVQGRGEEKYINRWGPFYSHSIVKGYDKRWYAWPLVRRAQWEEEGLLRTKTQFLYVLYVSHRQQSLARPSAPVGTLRHLWPLYSTWDNGAGRRQWQFLSPFDVLFPGNQKVQHAWTPLFTLARHDQRAPGDTRTSLFWDAITWRQYPASAGREFHVGPLFSVVEDATGKRVAFGNGLFGFQRTTAAGGWRMFWLDFRPKTVTTSARSEP